MCCVLFGLLIAVPTVAVPSVGEIERAALDGRLAITSAKVVIRARGERFHSGKSIATDADYTFWMDGKRLRTDVVRSSGPDAGVRVTTCENCEREGWGVLYHEKPGQAASFLPLARFSKLELTDAIDPRKIGLDASPIRVLRQARLDQVVGRTDRTAPEIRSEKYGGKDCWVIRFAINPPDHKTQVAAWISPAEGNSVVRIELTQPVEGTPSRWVVSSEVTTWPPAKVWYPRTVKFEEYRGDKLVQHETADVTEASLNQPIPAETFTLAGIQMKADTYVRQPSDGESGFWRDGKIDTSNKSVFKDTTPPAPVGSSESKVNYWLVAVCVVLALAAVIVVILRRRSIAA